MFLNILAIGCLIILFPIYLYFLSFVFHYGKMAAAKVFTEQLIKEKKGKINDEKIQ